MATLRDVQRRIKSTQSTKKITRAMELISASKVQKAQNRMREARPYADAITAAVAELYGNAGETSHAYLTPRPNPTAAAVIVVTSDRGLAGAFSSGVLRQAEELFALLRSEGKEPRIYVTGRKGVAYFKFRGRPVAGSWTGFSDGPVYENVKPIADAALADFRDGVVDEIFVVFTEFVSSLTQRAGARRLLPLEVVESEAAEDYVRPPAYEYEPDPTSVLEALMPRYIEARLFSAYLEAAASEHAARRRSMSTATENATGLIEDLTRQYNQARQAAITQELMEVVGAAEASSGSK